MRNLFLSWITVSTCVFPLAVSGSTHNEYFNNYLPSAERMVEDSGYRGPIGKLLAKWALARQVLEDGVKRNPNISCAGISKGEPNKSVVLSVIKDTTLKIGTAKDGEGGSFYKFEGTDANLYSTLIIAKLFDSYVERFFKKDIKTWKLSKEISHALHIDPDSFEMQLKFHTGYNPEKIIEKSCNAYGPGKAAINIILKTCSLW